MTTTLMLVRPLEHQPTLRRRPSGGRKRRPKPAELAFCSLVFNRFPGARYEPETLETARGKNGELIEAVTPDLYLPGYDIFLELTLCDRFMDQESLPPHVQWKNTTRSQSRQPHISPAEYIARKQAKIARAERIHGIPILLLQSSLQDEIHSRPVLLDELIAAKLGHALSIPLLHLA